MTKQRICGRAATAILAAGALVPAALALTPTAPGPVIPELDRLRDEARVSLEFTDVPAVKVIDAIASAGEIHLDAQGPEGDGLISVSLSNFSVRQALEAVAAQIDLRYEVVDARSLRVILPSPLLPTEDMTLPELVATVEPDYPPDARASRIEGEVVLRIVIREDGSVGEVEVLDAVPGWPAIDVEAATAVSRWKYRPAIKNGRPVSVYATVKVGFRLR